jgi:hypothetical protein
VGIGWGFADSTNQFSTTGCGKIEVSSKQITRCVAEPPCSAFLLELIMLKSQQAVVQNFCTKLQSHLDSGVALREALNKVKPLYNTATPEQQVAMRDSVAQVIGKFKGVKPKRLEKGAYKGYLGFDAHGSDAENQARTMLQYYFPVEIKKKKGSSQQQVVQQVDEVEELLKKLYALSKPQQQRFRKLYLNDTRK